MIPFDDLEYYNKNSNDPNPQEYKKETRIDDTHDEFTLKQLLEKYGEEAYIDVWLNCSEWYEKSTYSVAIIHRAIETPEEIQERLKNYEEKLKREKYHATRYQILRV